MGNRVENNIKWLDLEKLIKIPVGEKLQEAMRVFQSVQKNLDVLSEKEEPLKVTGIKAATVLTFTVLKKIAGGKNPLSFDAADYKDLANAVSKYAVFMDGDEYSIFVFRLYENCIRFSVIQLKKSASSQAINAIEKLADELHNKEDLFRNGGISEAAYIEDCMWISLEAMIKLLASSASLFCGQQATEFTQALASCAFEYGRLMLYRKEQMLVNQFIESQYRLDEELEKKYAEYLSELEARSEQFYSLINHAFAPDFRTAFLHSILLANTAGVKEANILSSTEEIDSFFLD